MSGRPENLDRQNSIALGLRTYTGEPHSRCGTTERYVSGGGCVHCARETATMQRAALKLIKAQTAVVNHDADKPLDNSKTPEQIADEQSIEDML